MSYEGGASVTDIQIRTCVVHSGRCEAAIGDTLEVYSEIWVEEGCTSQTGTYGAAQSYCERTHGGDTPDMFGRVLENIWHYTANNRKSAISILDGFMENLVLRSYTFR